MGPEIGDTTRAVVKIMQVEHTTSTMPGAGREARRARGWRAIRAGWWNRAIDIRMLGILFIVSGLIDLLWILSYPDYALKVFGTTFSGWAGEAVKLQHPCIHLAIGLGFFLTRRWALWGYLAYLALACASEIVTQIVLGYHPVRTTMIAISLVFAAYVVARRQVFH